MASSVLVQAWVHNHQRSYSQGDCKVLEDKVRILLQDSIHRNR